MAAATVADESEYVRAARRQRFRRIGLIIAIVVALIIVGVIWHRHEASAAAAAAAKRAAAAGISITSTAAETGDINVYLYAIGTVTPVFTDSITSQVNGPVMAVNFREGQLVNKGDSLIEIDPRPYRATLLQAQGILERDQNVLAQAADGSEALPGGAGAQRHCAADRRRSGKTRAAGPGHGQERSGHGAVR